MEGATALNCQRWRPSVLEAVLANTAIFADNADFSFTPEELHAIP